MEQEARRKKLFSNDLFLFAVTLASIFLCVGIVNYASYIFGVQLIALQIALFVFIFGGCYFVLYRQMTYYRYVLGDDSFTVYRITGKRQKLVEKVAFSHIRFITPYSEDIAKKGLEHNCAISKKTAAYIMAFVRKDKHYSLIFSPDENMLTALEEKINS